MEGGGVQWGGLNEDAADYPIRKFSLHFDRARRAASNKNYSVLYAIRFPLLAVFPRANLYPSNLFFLSAKNVDQNSGKNSIFHLISIVSEVFRSLEIPSIDIR